jgi:serine/threonine-protein kinase
MSPEQLQMSSGVDARTDIWSLGVLLFELLCGRLPFEGEAATALAINIATMAPLALRSVRPDVPIGLEKVVMACLEKDRERRYQDVGELAKALEPFGPERAKVSVERVMATVQAGRGVRVAPSPPPVALPTRAPGSGTPTATMMNWGETGQTGHRRRNALVGVILAAVVAAGVVILATKASEPLGTATASSSPAALGPAPTPAPPGPSASTAPSDRSTPPTVSPSDLPLAPPPRTTPSGNRAPKALAAPSSAARSGASATTAATPPAAPAYNPLEHL